MDTVRTKYYSFTAAAAAALILFAAVHAVFYPAIAKKRAELKEARIENMRVNKLLLKKSHLENEWEIYRPFFEKQKSGRDELQKVWIEQLLNYSSAHNLVFTKLEPQGIRGGKKQPKEFRLYLSFRGDILALTGLINYLIEKEPLSRIDSVVIRNEDDHEAFFYEIILARSLA